MLKKQNKNNNLLNVQMVWTKQEINQQKQQHIYKLFKSISKKSPKYKN